jgi:hypothetical protein
MIADLQREEKLLDRVESGKKDDASAAARQMSLPFSE